MFHRVLVLVGSLCYCGALAVNGNSTEPYGLRLVGGGGRCRGQLQLQRSGQDWTEVNQWLFSLQLGDRVCAELDCGSALTVEEEERDVVREGVRLKPGFCNETSLVRCFCPGVYRSDHSLTQLNCSDSVRLVGGRSLCSGSLQIRDQSSNQSWAGVCDGALDRRGAEVLCRELGCGAPLLQGALSPLGQSFHCEGHESALMDCPRTGTHPGTCSTLNLTCAEPLRLVGGASRCEGTVELKVRGEWRRVMGFPDPWDLESAAVVCRSLDCGSAVSTEERQGFDLSDVWGVRPACVKERAAVRDCVFASRFRGREYGVEVVCAGEG